MNAAAAEAFLIVGAVPINQMRLLGKTSSRTPQEQTNHMQEAISLIRDVVATALCRRAASGNNARAPRHSEAATSFMTWL